MKRLFRPGWLPLLLLLTCAAVAGCTQSPAAQAPAPPPPEVLVSLPVTREVTDYEDFPGRTEAVNSIDVRARVTGYLDKVNFKEGYDVKKDDVLFEIDPRPYQAELNRAEANVVLAEAHLSRLNSDYQRADSLLRTKAIGREEFDKIAGDRAEANATVGVAKAGRDLARLNLDFTKVKSPISGRISRRFVDPGNLVKADDTILTSVVSLDPMYAYFDLDERTTLRVQRELREGKIHWSDETGLPVRLGLSDEEGHPHEGRINFADNRVDPETGTWRLRALFVNPDRVLSPGLYVRMRLPVGEPFSALLVAEQALGNDQGQKVVYVVKGPVTDRHLEGVDKAGNKTVRDVKGVEGGMVESRRVKVGRLHDGLRVINDGVRPGELVVVSGLQRVRQGAPANAELVDMPAAVAGNSGKSEIRNPKPETNPNDQKPKS